MSIVESVTSVVTRVWLSVGESVTLVVTRVRFSVGKLVMVMSIEVFGTEVVVEATTQSMFKVDNSTNVDIATVNIEKCHDSSFVLVPFVTEN